MPRAKPSLNWTLLRLPTYEHLLALVGDVGDEHFEEVTDETLTPTLH